MGVPSVSLHCYLSFSLRKQGRIDILHCLPRLHALAVSAAQPLLQHQQPKHRPSPRSRCPCLPSSRRKARVFCPAHIQAHSHIISDRLLQMDDCGLLVLSTPASFVSRLCHNTKQSTGRQDVLVHVQATHMVSCIDRPHDAMHDF